MCIVLGIYWLTFGIIWRWHRGMRSACVPFSLVDVSMFHEAVSPRRRSPIVWNARSLFFGYETVHGMYEVLDTCATRSFD